MPEPVSRADTTEGRTNREVLKFAADVMRAVIAAKWRPIAYPDRKETPHA